MSNPFIRNEYGLWCPNCQERIDEFWPELCDACGYPAPDHERYDEPDDYDDYAPEDWSPRVAFTPATEADRAKGEVTRPLQPEPYKENVI